jgi:hypothetical protein
MATERNPFDPIPTTELSIVEIESGTLENGEEEGASIEYDPEVVGLLSVLKLMLMKVCLGNNRMKLRKSFSGTWLKTWMIVLLMMLQIRCMIILQPDKDSRADWGKHV